MSFDPDKYLAKKSQDQQGGGFNPDAYLKSKGVEPVSLKEEPGFLGQAADAVIKAGQFVDSYTGAPTRAAIGAMQDGKNPFSAYGAQFGENPELAPTGKELAEGFGVSDKKPLVNTAEQRQKFDELHNPGMAQAMKQAGGYQDQYGFSPSQIAGLGIDVGADPLNVVPFAAMAKGAGRLAKSAIGGAARGAAKGFEALSETNRMAKIVEDTAKATRQALDNVFRPTQADDWAKWSEIAAKNGINPMSLPESVEFGPGSVVSRTARAVREGPIGQESIEAFQDALMQVDSAVDTRISRIAGGLPLNEVEAGGLIRQSYDDAVERLFNDIDFTYDQVTKLSPGVKLTEDSMARLGSKLNGLERWANGRLKRGITKTDREQAKQVLQGVAAVRAGNGSLKQTVEALKDIGRFAFKTGKVASSDIPPDIEKFRDLYFTLRDEVLETTAKVYGKDVANSLIDSNQLITNFMREKEPIAKILNNKTLAPEKLFKSLIVGGDTNRIAALRDILTPEQFNQLKGSYLASIIKRNSDETINFGALRTRIQKDRPIISVLFEPEEISDFVELVQLGERFGPSVLSTSGTGGSNIFRNMLEGVKSGATNRTVLEGMKESARARSAPMSYGRPAQITGATSNRLQLPRRTKPEEVSKYLQILATQNQSNEKEKDKEAAQRRLEAIKKLNGGN